MLKVKSFRILLLPIQSRSQSSKHLPYPRGLSSNYHQSSVLWIGPPMSNLARCVRSAVPKGTRRGRDAGLPTRVYVIPKRLWPHKLPVPWELRRPIVTLLLRSSRCRRTEERQSNISNCFFSQGTPLGFSGLMCKDTHGRQQRILS